MKNYKYERAVATNSVTDDLLTRLGMLGDDSSPAPKMNKVNKSGFKKVESKRLFELTQKNFSSRSVLTKMVKTHDRTSKKAFKLNVENINEEIDTESDYDNKRANSKNVGLPQINEFYKKCKDIDKRLQKNQHKKNSHIAYLSQAKDLPIVPLPAGLANHKGRNGEINLYNKSIGNMQAQAIGTAIKL